MVRRFLGLVTSSAVDYPVTASVLIAVLTAFLALFIPRLNVDTSAEGFMVDRDPARVVYDRFKQQFGTDSVTMVLLKADDVFRPDVLEAVRRLTDQLEQIEGVVRVESLATARRVRVDNDTIETRPLLDTVVPSDSSALNALRTQALAQRVLVGNVVAPDSRATAMIVYTDPQRGDVEFNRRFVARLDALLETEQRPGLTLYEVGRPLLKHEYARYILRDLVRLIPISAGIMLVILFVLFQSVDAVLVPILSGGISVVWSLGMMALFGIPLNVVTAVIPTLLITIGFAEDVHIISDYHERARDGLGPSAALKAALTETAAPILVTTITTVLGFASLALSDVPMLAQFGYASAFSLAGNYVATMAVLPPTVLALAGRANSASVDVKRHWGERSFARFLEWLGWFNLRHRVKILSVAGVALIAGAIGLSRIDVNTDFVSFFPTNSPVRTRAADAHRSLTGTEMFSVVIDTHRPDGIKDPHLLNAIARLQAYLRDTHKIDKTVSIVDYLMTINRDMHDGRPEEERVPDSADAVAQYLLLVDGRDLASFVNADASSAVVLVRHSITGSARMNELERMLDTQIPAVFPAGVDVNYTGEAILTNNASDYMALNELTSFTFTFLAIAAIHSVLFMSVRIGMLSLIPDLIPIVVVYGLMAVVGVPLNTGTALIATIAIGISVDDTVHHLMTHARELNAYPVPSMAMFSTLRKVGRPVICASLALAAGFLPPLGSSFVPLKQFGLFSAITMLFALVTELVVTPSLMLTVRVVTVWDMVMLRLDPERLAESPCFRGFSQWELRKILLLGMLRNYAPGAAIAARGEPGGALFLVVSGKVANTRPTEDGSRIADQYQAGDVFGELADESTAWSSDVLAVEASELLLLDFDSLERLRRRFPFTAAKLFRNIASMLTARLRSRPATGSAVRGLQP